MTKKTLADYILTVRKDYKYIVRLAIDEISNEQMDRIELNLQEYDLKDISKPKKTMWQKHAIGFTEPNLSEVFIFEMTLGLPASCFWIGRKIAQIIKVSEARVVVNGIDNPVIDLDKIEHKDYYGTEYNDNLVKTIQDAKKKEPDSIVQTAKTK